MAGNGGKSHATALHLCKTGDSLSDGKQIDLSLSFYTLGLLYAPAVHSEDLSTQSYEEHPLALLFCNRSLAMYRLKRYRNCIDDIQRSFANGKHDDARSIALLSRLAWCYWNLKEYKKCSEILENAKIIPIKACKELDLLASLIAKSKVNLDGDTNSRNKNDIKKEMSNSRGALRGGEHKLLKGISSCANWNNKPSRGRFLTTNAIIKPGSMLVDEEAYCGILTYEFVISNCNYCFKKCKDSGISCCGCSKALYCNEQCRLLAWQAYHWLECCMWPVLEKVDAFCRLSLRVLLCAADQMKEQESEDAKDCFTLIAQYLHSTFNVTQNKAPGKRKGQKKSTKHRPEMKLDGRNSRTGEYKRNYWSVFCLQSHENDHSKTILTKSTLYANFLAKVLSKIPASFPRKQHKSSSGDHSLGFSSSTAVVVKNAFARLRLASFCDVSNENSAVYQDIETFRGKTLKVCKSMAAEAPVPKLKPQSCFHSKDTPRSFQEVLSFLLRRHMLQLQTNCQAIYDIVDDNPHNANDVSIVSQQRIASAIFPSTSLLNHSCNANTLLNFSGRRVQVRAIHSIPEAKEITHCYGPCMSRHSFKDRQKLLKEQYCFDCSCATCAKYKAGDFEEQVFLQQFTAYKCSSCDGPILILDSKVQDEASVFGKCANEACKRVCNLSEMQNAYNKIVGTSNTIAQRLLKRFDEEDLKTLELCLKQLKDILFQYHHAISNLHDQLAYYHSYKKDFKSAAKHVTASLKVTSMRFGSESVEAVQEMFKLATIYFNCKMKSEAEKFLKKTLDIHRKIAVLDKNEAVRAEAMLLALQTCVPIP